MNQLQVWSFLGDQYLWSWFRCIISVKDDAAWIPCYVQALFVQKGRLQHCPAGRSQSMAVLDHDLVQPIDVIEHEIHLSDPAA